MENLIKLLIFALTFYSTCTIAAQCSDFLGNRHSLLSPLAVDNNDFLDEKVRNFFRDRTGGFGRGDSALEHHFPSLLVFAGNSRLTLAEAVTRSLKWTANEIIGSGSSNWFMRNHYQISYEGWVTSAKMMLEKIKGELTSANDIQTIESMILYIETELNDAKVKKLRYQ